MNKSKLLKTSIYTNLFILFIFIYCFSISNKEQSSYFNIGWSNEFVFISMPINTAYKYFAFCGFIIISNVSEVLMDNIAGPLIQFSTYNPYKNEVSDFSRYELELYSNAVIFIQISKKLLQIFIILSQVDIALISLLSSQLSASYAIHYLLNQKVFVSNNDAYIEIPPFNFNI
tara:strand:- start:1217 stop:1735 length:519 start_codon:yes stop_codon:yes gene_type:complete